MCVQIIARIPDVCGFLYPTERLHSRMEVLGILGVGDEHCRPLLKLQVREAEHVVVHGKNSVPASEMRTVSDFGHGLEKNQHSRKDPPRLRGSRTCNETKT